MTPEELMAIDPAELAKLSDAELGERLEPLIPTVRAAYIAKGEETITTNSGQKIGRRTVDRSVDMLANLLKIRN